MPDPTPSPALAVGQTWTPAKVGGNVQARTIVEINWSVCFRRGSTRGELLLERAFPHNFRAWIKRTSATLTEDKTHG